MLFTPKKKTRYRSSRLREHKKKVFIWKVSIAAFLFIACVVGVSVLSRHHSMHISQINILGNVYSNEQKILEVTEEKLKGNYFGILSRSNSFLFSRGRIEKAILEQFAEVEKVRVDFESKNSINVRITEFNPVAKWCKDFVSEEAEVEEDANEIILSKEDCYLVSEKGFIFAREPLINTLDLVKFKNDHEGEPIRSYYLNEDLFKDLVHFTDLLKERLNIEVVTVERADEFSFNMFTTDKLELRIDTEDDVLEVFDNLQTFLNSDEVSEISLADLEYIDLRFGNKVFYKKRFEVTVEERSEEEIIEETTVNPITDADEGSDDVEE